MRVEGCRAQLPASQTIGRCPLPLPQMPADPPHALPMPVQGGSVLSAPPQPEQLSVGLQTVAAAVPRHTAICSRCGCWRQRKGEASVPRGRLSSSGPGGSDRARRGKSRAGKAHWYLSLPIKTLSSAPHPQDGGRRDVSQPISRLAEQGLYPLLPWQPAFPSGSLALCTWYRNDSQGRVGRIRGRMGTT